MSEQAPEIIPLTPANLAEGLEKLLRMKPLDGFDFDRWAQIRRDCTKLIKDHGAAMVAFNWTLADVFGVTRGYCVNESGLAFCLRGGKVSRMRERFVFLWRPVGGTSKWARKSGWAKPSTLRMIWEGADVGGPVWHCPRNSPLPPPRPGPSVPAALPLPEVAKLSTLVIPVHAFAAIMGPSCAVH